MWSLQRYMLQAVRTRPCSSSSYYGGRRYQRIIRGNRDFNAVPVGIAKPERITHLRIAIALFQLDFNTGQVKASGKRSEFSICINLEGQVMKVGALKRVTSIA